jgi:hypothetical protein
MTVQSPSACAISTRFEIGPLPSGDGYSETISMLYITSPSPAGKELPEWSPQAELSITDPERALPCIGEPAKFIRNCLIQLASRFDDRKSLLEVDQ